MTNPLQLLRDFRKWRKERYDEALRKQCLKEAKLTNYPSEMYQQGYNQGLLYGIEHRKEILKQVKI